MANVRRFVIGTFKESRTAFLSFSAVVDLKKRFLWKILIRDELLKYFSLESFVCTEDQSISYVSYSNSVGAKGNNSVVNVFGIAFA